MNKKRSESAYVKWLIKQSNGAVRTRQHAHMLTGIVLFLMIITLLNFYFASRNRLPHTIDILNEESQKNLQNEIIQKNLKRIKETPNKKMDRKHE